MPPPPCIKNNDDKGKILVTCIVTIHNKQWWQGANIDRVHKTTSTNNDKEVYELAQINKKIKF
jgi:hypothetical protein